MNKEASSQEEALESALSPIVNRLIDKNYEDSQEKIASQMAPLIGSAIREQIKSQKDDVVDALYPVLGNIISRYVTKTLEDMLNTINTQIQSGLSYKALKRKATAKLRGVSESELLLNENATVNIRALLLIHKETGIVLAHSENPQHPVSEPEMLASMMTAIRSFVNDWIEQNNNTQELGEIEYGGNKIIIETSGYSYLAVIVEGSAYKATYDKIRETLENIVLKYGDSIREFNGDLDKFSNLGIYREISRLLNWSEKKEEKQKLHPLLLFIPILLLIWGGYSYYLSYQNRELEQTLEQQFYKTPQLSMLKIETQVQDEVVTLSGHVPFAYHKALAQTLTQKIIGERVLHNELVVINSLEDPMQISSNISYLLRGLNAHNGIDLTYSYDYALLLIRGSVINQRVKERVIEEIQQLKNIQKIEYDIKIVPPQLDVTIYFDKAQTSLSPHAQAKLFEAAKIISELDKEYLIKLTSYSDQIGTQEKNRALSEQRLANTTRFLQEQGGITHKFVSILSLEAPKGVDLKDEPNKARCVRISYKKKESNASL